MNKERFIVIRDQDFDLVEVVPKRNYPVYTVTLGWIDGPEDIEEHRIRHFWEIDVVDYDPSADKKSLAGYARKLSDMLKGFKKEGFSWYTQEFRTCQDTKVSSTTVTLDTPDNPKTISVEGEIVWDPGTSAVDIWQHDDEDEKIFTPEEIKQIKNISINIKE